MNRIPKSPEISWYNKKLNFKIHVHKDNDLEKCKLRIHEVEYLYSTNITCNRRGPFRETAN
jgi:hypothetical protein